MNVSAHAKVAVAARRGRARASGPAVTVARQARYRLGAARTPSPYLMLVLAIGLILPTMALAADTGKGTGTKQSSQLYTQPDPAATGGLRGRFDPSVKPVVAVMALAVDNWKSVYRATLKDGGRAFAFGGLPVGRYDLVVVTGDAFFEGLTLARTDDTLTPEDRKSIEAAISKSTPFFDTKRLHRTAGLGGEEGKARGVLQEVRTRPVTLQSAEVRNDIQVRSLKVVLAESAGRPGWSLVNTREIIRQEVTEGQTKGLLAHHYVPHLGGLRVVDEVKDLGMVALP